MKEAVHPEEEVEEEEEATGYQLSENAKSLNTAYEPNSSMLEFQLGEYDKS